MDELLKRTFIIFTSLSLQYCKPLISNTGFGLGGHQRLKQAEELLRQDKFDQAIEAYQEHMQERLSSKNRPDWENPYFYYLLIGDIELGRGQVSKALAAYEFASKNNIHSSLISDRYRFVASWYEARGEYDDAIDILKKHRDLDPLLFDAMLDRIAKHITYLEDIASQNDASTPQVGVTAPLK